MLLASLKGHIEVAKLFLSIESKTVGDISTESKKVGDRDVDGSTALFIAAQYGYVTTVELLLSKERMFTKKIRCRGLTA